MELGKRVESHCEGQEEGHEDKKKNKNKRKKKKKKKKKTSAVLGPNPEAVNGKGRFLAIQQTSQMDAHDNMHAIQGDLIDIYVDHTAAELMVA